MNSLWIALALYTIFPVPQADWSEKNMKYSMCFFPIAGVLVGGIMWIFWRFSGALSMPLRAAVMTILPALLTGGIHVDGFLDTTDARKSYKPAKEKMRILKDPHVGSAAVMHGIFYFILTFGLFTEMENKAITAVCLGYIFSRALSGLSVVSFPKARKDGMAAEAANAAGGRVRGIMIAEAAAAAALMVIFGGVAGTLGAAAALAVFIYYRRMSEKEFGGVTGDLAGWFLQVSELFILIACTAAVIVLR